MTSFFGRSTEAPRKLLIELEFWRSMHAFYEAGYAFGAVATDRSLHSVLTITPEAGKALFPDLPIEGLDGGDDEEKMVRQLRAYHFTAAVFGAAAGRGMPGTGPRTDAQRIEFQKTHMPAITQLAEALLQRGTMAESEIGTAVCAAYRDMFPEQETIVQPSAVGTLESSDDDEWPCNGTLLEQIQYLVKKSANNASGMPSPQAVAPDFISDEDMAKHSPAPESAFVTAVREACFKLITPKDVQEYGPELIDLVKRAAREAMEPQLNALRQENASLAKKLDQLASAFAEVSSSTH